MPSAAINALKSASKGLLYPSETDAPFTTFQWKRTDGELTPVLLRRLTKREDDAPVDEITLTTFFQDLTKEEDWHGKPEQADVKKFRNLQQAIKDHLADVRVFRVGETQIDIYIVGMTSEGSWAGLKTRAVET